MFFYSFVISHFQTHFGLLYDSILLLAHGLVTLTKTRPLLPQKLTCERPPGLWPLGLSLINAMKSVSWSAAGNDIVILSFSPVTTLFETK